MSFDGGNLRMIGTRMERKDGAAEVPYVFKPHEHPSLPGSPFNPEHPLPRRVGYAFVGVLAALTGGLGNALVSANLTYIQGWLGLYSDQAAWLVVVYVTTNVCANLVLVKVRQQFGLQPFMRGILTAYALATLSHLFIQGFWSAVLVRAVSGIAAAGLSALGLLNIIQAAPPAKRMTAMIIGSGVPALALPLARVISPSLLAWDAWRMTYWFELGLALMTLAAILILPLPPSVRQGRVFERSDFVTIALLFPGVACLCSVLGLGRIVWWTNEPWIAFASIAAIVLISIGLAIEHYRARPLLTTRWLRHPAILLVGIELIAIRVLSSEQTFISVNFFTTLGMGVDQLAPLFAIVTLASIIGIALAVMIFKPSYPGRAVPIAFMLIAAGSFIDGGSTNLTRPENALLSQSLVGIGALVAVGPLFVIGFSRVFLEGPQALISWVILFNATQNIGSLLGPAFFGTFQIIREKFHSSQIAEQIVLTNPVVAQAIGGSAKLLGGTVADPILRSAEGAASLAQVVTREANILAYNDAFLLAGLLACIGVLASLGVEVMRLRAKSSVVRFQELMRDRAAALEDGSAEATG